ncbi:hypothetical protein PA06A_05658 [Cutibacterium acnes P06A]|nr:hypothetical protein [Cutibacterium acnes P06A]MCM4182105.1 hypothetical protein [Cutibacterium acnes P06B]
MTECGYIHAVKAISFRTRRIIMLKSSQPKNGTFHGIDAIEGPHLLRCQLRPSGLTHKSTCVPA